VPRPGSVAYTATKHAVTGLTRAVALDGRAHGIAVGQIDVGNASTEMTAGIATGARQADGSVRPEPTFDPAHVAATVAHIARLPLDVSVPFTTVLATGMPYLGRG
jgi:NAD(P)-dependent dehydrogenase (short-subunit alcohol dehydrogenase family)